MKSNRCNLILTFAGRKSYICRYFSSAARAGRIIPVDSDPRAPIGRSSVHFEAVPPVVDAEEYVCALEQLCRENQVNAVLPLNDRDVVVLGRAKRRLEASGARTLVPDPDTCESLADKLVASTWLSDRGFDSPRTWTLQEARSVHSLGRRPLIVKARSGQGSAGFRELADSSDLGSLKGDLVVQERLDGVHFDLDIVRGPNGGPALVLPKRKLEMSGGTAAVCRAETSEELVDLGRQLAEAMNLVGVIDVDVVLASRKAWILDVNPRLGGCFPFACVFAPELPDAILAVAMGENPPEKIACDWGMTVYREYQFVGVRDAAATFREVH